MRVPFFVAPSGLLFVAQLAAANIITFGDVSVGAPIIVVGNGMLDITSTPVGEPTAGGYGILDSSYTVTATKVAPIQVDWLSNRKFSTNADSDITVSILGEVSVSMTAGSLAAFQVGGLIDSNVNPTVLFNADPIMGSTSDARINWGREKTKGDVGKGDNHTLDMVTSLAWNPVAAGNTLTISSFLYSVEASAAAANPIREPGSLVMLASGLLATAAVSRRRSREEQPLADC
jgi:hypothetical protein